MAQPDDMLDDEDYPAYTMGRAAEIIGCSPDFLRRLGEAKLIDPLRSGGGHRRYSRYQIRLAARAREMCDQGTDMASAVRIIILEDQLEEALRHNADHHDPLTSLPGGSEPNESATRTGWRTLVVRGCVRRRPADWVRRRRSDARCPLALRVPKMPSVLVMQHDRIRGGVRRVGRVGGCADA